MPDAGYQMPDKVVCSFRYPVSGIRYQQEAPPGEPEGAFSPTGRGTVAPLEAVYIRSPHHTCRPSVRSWDFLMRIAVAASCESPSPAGRHALPRAAFRPGKLGRG